MGRSISLSIYGNRFGNKYTSLSINKAVSIVGIVLKNPIVSQSVFICYREPMASGEDEKAAGRVALHRLFVFADRTDAALMAVGAVAAVANGMVQPIMAFIFGDVIDAFGSGATDGVVRRVVQVAVLHFAFGP